MVQEPKLELPKVGFYPPGKMHTRLSMKTVNHYAYAERPPPDNDFTLLG
jgi:hypothetical protein